MYRFLSDEDFDNDIVRGIRRLRPDIDLVRIQDVGLNGAKDPEVLEWAAEQDRILLTHDASTMTAHVADRVRGGMQVPRVVVSRQGQPIRAVIEAIAQMADEDDPDLFGYPIRFLNLPRS